MAELLPVGAGEVLGKQQGRCCPTVRAVPHLSCPPASQTSSPAGAQIPAESTAEDLCKPNTRAQGEEFVLKSF